MLPKMVSDLQAKQKVPWDSECQQVHTPLGLVAVALEGTFVKGEESSVGR